MTQNASFPLVLDAPAGRYILKSSGTF